MNTHASNTDFPDIIRTRYGQIAIPRESDDLIGRFLRHYGEWSFLEVQFVASFLPKGARVLDIGAYIGTFSLGLAQVANLEFVAMVEANAASAKLLIQNAETGLKCSHEVVSALVVDSSSANISEGWAIAGNIGSTSFINRPPDAISVEPVRERIEIQSLVERFAPLQLVKLDVEGMEKQLLSSYPSLLRNNDTLLWLECNESSASLELCQLLLDTGRPVTYFAWPSHNESNYHGAVQKIFPFAHEAGLLVGAAPRTLTSEQQQADCIVRRIFNLEDLREAMWSTPRWAPPEWDQLTRSQLAAVASNVMLGKRRETFLDDTRQLEDNGGPPVSLRQLQRENAVKGARVAYLEHLLADHAQQQYEAIQVISNRLTEAEESHNRERTELFEANQEISNRLMKAEESHNREKTELFEANQEISNRLMKAVESHNWEKAELQNHVLAERLKASEVQIHLQHQLDQILGSVTWRGAVRLSTLLGYVPFSKRIVKYLLRKKGEWRQS